MTVHRYRARLGTIGLLLLAVWEITALVHAHQAAPSTGDWRAVSTAVHHTARKGALIVFAPRWIEPIGRLWLGDLMTVDQVARMDATRYSEVWEVSIRGATAPEMIHEQPDFEQPFGRIRLRRFTRRAPEVTWDLVQESRIHEVNFEPHKGVRLELDHANDERRLTFDDVPLGAALQVYGGLADYRLRHDNRAVALLRVLIDHREVSRALIDNDSGWVPLPAATTMPGRHRVELVASVYEPRDSIHVALCVAAEAWVRGR